MKTIHILADDLTGALDSAAAFGGEVPVHLDLPQLADGSTAPVSVLTTPTRDIPKDEIPAHLQPALEWFRSAHFSFKKVDSLLRGNTFAEIAWLLQAGGFASATFAPAFPAQGRMTIDGQQWITKPNVASGPRTAVANKFQEAFGAFGLDAGPDGASTIWTPDAVSEADLDRIIETALASTNAPHLLCGSAGLAFALARHTGLTAASGKLGSPLPTVGNGPKVLISASHHSVLRKQWAVLRRELRPKAIAEHGCEDEIVKALERAGDGAKTIWFDLSPQAEMNAAQAATLLASQTKLLMEKLPQPSQLIVVGGDTLLSLCRTARVETLYTRPPVRNGWGCARLHGGTWDGTPCYSRSGAFGEPDDLLQIIRLLDGSENSLKGNRE